MGRAVWKGHTAGQRPEAASARGYKGLGPGPPGQEKNCLGPGIKPGTALFHLNKENFVSTEKITFRALREMILKLRKTTGGGFLDCKKALEITAGDFEKALKHVRQLQKERYLKTSHTYETASRTDTEKVSLLPISITEEAVLNPDALPEALRDWRFYRIEYGGPNESCLWEGKILLPRSADPRVVETLLLGLQAQNELWQDVGILPNEVECKFCHKSVLIGGAHRHGDGWVGECCWDERLRATE